MSTVCVDNMTKPLKQASQLQPKPAAKCSPTMSFHKFISIYHPFPVKF